MYSMFTSLALVVNVLNQRPSYFYTVTNGLNPLALIGKLSWYALLISRSRMDN